MKKVVIYTGDLCIHCKWAIDLLKKKNIQFTELAVDSHGTIHAENLNEAIRRETVLISLISANNETGKLQSIEELTKTIFGLYFLITLIIFI